MRVTIIAILTLLASTAASAQEPVIHRSISGRIGHYLNSHKELLAQDFFTVAPLLADAISSTHCQKALGQNCVETSPIFPKHPSELQTYGVELGFASGLVALNHLIVHMTHDGDYPPAMKHFPWLTAVALSGVEVGNVYGNVCATERGQRAERLAEARARLREP